MSKNLNKEGGEGKQGNPTHLNLQRAEDGALPVECLLSSQEALVLCKRAVVGPTCKLSAERSRSSSALCGVPGQLEKQETLSHNNSKT